jgi:hypothetical protein
MRFLPPAAQEETAVVLPRVRGRFWSHLARAELLVGRAAARPYLATLAILTANLALAAVFIGLGELLFSDPAEFFRELMPGTWLSFAELLIVAVAAWAIYQRVTGARRLRLNNFWGLSVAVFVVFAIDEITQATIFVADILARAGALAPEGFKDLDAFLLSVLFLASGVALLRYGLELLRHPQALGLLLIGAALGAGSQTLDAVVPQSSFVAEETLKLASEAFLIGGFLLVLHRVGGSSARSAGTGSGRLSRV